MTASNDIRSNPRALVHRSAEAYINAAQLCVAMGVSKKTVQRWTREGMPSQTWGLGHTRRYLLSACTEWARERESAGSVDKRQLTLVPR